MNSSPPQEQASIEVQPQLQGSSTRLGHASIATSPPEKEKHASAYEQVTARVLAMLEAGTVPWQKPWNVRTGPPRNFVSKRPYRGINVFLLLSAAYESPFWLTFRQANQLGGHIRKGERGSPIVFCKQIEVDGKDAGEPGQLRLLRFYHVFNVAQCENLGNIPPLSEQLGTLMKPAQIVANMPRPPHLRPGMARAFYSPGEDAVGMPTPSRFTSEEEYYSALFHELIHSTGHESRLNRPTLTEQVGFGSDPYCKEELIAEMGAAFLCAHAGIIERTLDNSSAYIDGWLERLRRDRRLLVHAAAQAQSAADFILGVKSEDPAAETPNVGQP